MRIIAGTARGRPLLGPKTNATRPTSDLIRGVIFDILEHLADDWSRVLDLYAGTGALGIEALSRGAEEADFVEQSPALCKLITKNLAAVGFSGQGHVYPIATAAAIGRLRGPYGIILLDPPYADPGVEQALTALEQSSLVGPDTIVVVEHAKRRAPTASLTRLDVVKERRHGDTVVTMLRLRE